MNDNLLVAKAMPVHADRALRKFVAHNRGFDGAAWEDVLDRLRDEDANLAVTEPMYEALSDLHPSRLSLVTPVTLTLFYARTGRFRAPVDHDLVRELVGMVATMREVIER